MRPLRILLVAALVLSPLDVAYAGPRNPFRTLFTVPPITLSGGGADGHADTPPSSGSLIDTGTALLQKEAEKPPQPERSGLKALVYETGQDFVAFPQRRATLVILGIGAGAAALAHPVDTEVNVRIVGSDTVRRAFAPGKYLGSFYAQAGAAAGLYVVGRYVLPPAEGEDPTNKVSHLGFDMMRALVVSQVLTQGIKIAVRRDRPTGECCSFPSGHASAAFATASVLERHLGYRGAWPTFLLAGYVAASRLHDNRHYLSDVVFGSAVGIASGWTVVGRHGRSKYTLVPSPVKGGMMVSLVRVPGQALR